MFLGALGAPELCGNEQALASLRAELAGYGWTNQQIASYLDALDRDGQPVAYLFECRPCGTHLAYANST